MPDTYPAGDRLLSVLIRAAAAGFGTTITGLIAEASTGSTDSHTTLLVAAIGSFTSILCIVLPLVLRRRDNGQLVSALVDQLAEKQAEIDALTAAKGRRGRSAE